jgi:hypothetical protein
MAAGLHWQVLRRRWLLVYTGKFLGADGCRVVLERYRQRGDLLPELFRSDFEPMLQEACDIHDDVA